MLMLSYDGCDTLKCGSLKISYGDVVVGYMLALKCIVEDMCIC